MQAGKDQDSVEAASPAQQRIARAPAAARTFQLRCLVRHSLRGSFDGSNPQARGGQLRRTDDGRGGQPPVHRRDGREL